MPPAPRRKTTSLVLSRAPKLSSILDGVGEEAVLRTCFGLAGDFCRMTSDLMNLFAGFGVTGQIQLNTAKLDLPSSGL